MKLKPSSLTRSPLAKDCTRPYGKGTPCPKILGNLKLISAMLSLSLMLINTNTKSGNSITLSWWSLCEYLLAAVPVFPLYDQLPHTFPLTLCYSYLLPYLLLLYLHLQLSYLLYVQYEFWDQSAIITPWHPHVWASPPHSGPMPDLTWAGAHLWLQSAAVLQ